MIKNFFAPLFDAEKRVREYGREDRWQTVSVIIWLAIAAFAVMGFVDLLQRSYFPLATAIASVLMLYGGLRAGKKKKNTPPGGDRDLYHFGRILHRIHHLRKQ